MTKLAKFNGNDATLAALGFSVAEKERVIVEDTGVPRIFNYTNGGKKGGLGDEILANLPDVEEGSPVLSASGEFLALHSKKVRYIVLPNYLRQFWANRDFGKALIASSNEKKKFGSGRKEGATTGFQENFLSLLIVVGAEDSAGNKLVPIPTVSTFDKSRCPFFAQARKELNKVSTKEWAANSSDNAKLVVGKVPESLRVSHRIKVKLDTASHGMKYAKWTSDSQTTTVDTVNEIQEAMADPAWNVKFQEAIEMFTKISEDIDENLE